jgi:hypothetical protein
MPMNEMHGAAGTGTFVGFIEGRSVGKQKRIVAFEG